MENRAATDGETVGSSPTRGTSVKPAFGHPSWRMNRIPKSRSNKIQVGL